MTNLVLAAIVVAQGGGGQTFDCSFSAVRDLGACHPLPDAARRLPGNGQMLAWLLDGKEKVLSQSCSGLHVQNML